MKTFVWLAFVALLIAGQAEAAFHGRLPATPGGTDYQAYYDDQLEITWTADATQGGLATTTNHILAAENLNINGVTGWRLPLIGSDVDCTDPSVAQSACMVNEYGHLYWYGPGTVHGAGVTFENQAPFSNIAGNPGFWSGSEVAPFVMYTFGYGLGGTGADFVDCCVLYGWYVRDGDVGGGGSDADGDGVPDATDNCTLVSNAAQTDSNGDGIGNACDADLTGDCVVNFADLAIFKSAFPPNPYSADADFDGNGLVQFGDLALMKATFFNGPNPGPGPAAAGNECDASVT